MSKARGRRAAPVPPPRRRPSTLVALSAVALGGGVLLIALAMLLRPAPPSATSVSPVAPAVADLPTDGYTLGRADAPVTVHLYEDFQCPACRHWGTAVFPSLAANELASGRAKLVFHDFPFIGPESFTAAAAGQAAARQDGFWDLWATIYANQGPENSGALSKERLVAMARTTKGLDVDRFVADMDRAEVGPAISASVADAARAGVDSTPTLVIDGRLLVGASYADLASAIADAAH
jgi:protein-disulfide isomerase